MSKDYNEGIVSEEFCEECGELTSAWETYSPIGCQVSFLLCPKCLSANLELDELENKKED